MNYISVPTIMSIQMLYCCELITILNTYKRNLVKYLHRYGFLDATCRSDQSPTCGFIEIVRTGLQSATVDDTTAARAVGTERYVALTHHSDSCKILSFQTNIWHQLWFFQHPKIKFLS